MLTPFASASTFHTCSELHTIFFRVILGYLLVGARRVSADFNTAFSGDLVTAMKAELKLPWMPLDFTAQLIESGAALMDNNTLVDGETVKRALFAGIASSQKEVGPLLIITAHLTLYRIRPCMFIVHDL